MEPDLDTWRQCNAEEGEPMSRIVCQLYDMEDLDCCSVPTSHQNLRQKLEPPPRQVLLLRKPLPTDQHVLALLSELEQLYDTQRKIACDVYSLLGVPSDCSNSTMLHAKKELMQRHREYVRLAHFLEERIEPLIGGNQRTRTYSRRAYDWLAQADPRVELPGVVTERR